MRGKVGLIYLVYRAPTNKLTKVEDTTSWFFMQTWLVLHLWSMQMYEKLILHEQIEAAY